MYVYKHTYINTRMHVYIHACIYALYMNVCIYLYEYINICLYIYDNMCWFLYFDLFGRLKRGGSESSLPLINPASFGGKIAALAVSIRLRIPLLPYFTGWIFAPRSSEVNLLLFQCMHYYAAQYSSCLIVAPYTLNGLPLRSLSCSPAQGSYT